MSNTLDRRSFTLGVLGATFVPAAPALAQSLEKVAITWLPIMETMAFYVALDQKMFEKAGIDIQPTRFEAPNQIIDALVSGRAEVGAPGTAAGIAALAEDRFPGTFKVFGLQGGSIKAGRICDELIVAKDSAIAGFADLRGKTLGHLPGIQWRTISRHMVREAGLDPDRDVRLVDLAVGLQIPAIVSGNVDATLSLEPVGSIATNLGVVKRAVTNPCESVIADPFYSGASVLTTKFMKERPAVARKVVTVLDEATGIAERDFPRLRAILPKYTTIKADQVATAAQPYLRSFADLDATDLASYQALVDVFVAEQVLKKPMRIEGMILQAKDIGL